MRLDLHFYFKTRQTSCVSPPPMRGKKSPARDLTYKYWSGDYGGGETPLPIPNREVKPTRADGTASFRGGRVGRHQIYFLIASHYHDRCEAIF